MNEFTSEWVREGGREWVSVHANESIDQPNTSVTSQTTNQWMNRLTSQWPKQGWMDGQENRLPKPTNQRNTTDWLTTWPMNQSINQSINQSVTQSASQSVNQSVSQSINQSVSQSHDRSVDQCISINQSINQSINPPFLTNNQTAKQALGK